MKTNKMIAQILITLAIGLIIFVMYNTYMRATSKPIVLDKNITENESYSKMILAGGCFWCTESEYNHVPGIISAVSGYADSDKPNPTYEETGNGTVRARETVQVIYDPKIISDSAILKIYFGHIDPTDDSGQFADRGHQYSPAIYYTNETQRIEAENIIKNINDSKKFEKSVAVAVLPFNNFYPAEEYHQDYKDKNPVRYNLYREGSGRNSFIRLHWKDGSVSQAPSPWGRAGGEASFTQEMKDKRLKELTPLQYKVTQDEGTERPFQNEYDKNYEKGIYVDIVSGEPLYLSSDKYDSGTGWPSFTKPINSEVLNLKEDRKLFSTRVEVRSKIADSRLGHVFDDGPSDQGGKRYCMNSAALRFVPFADMEKEGYGEYINMLK